MKSKTAKLDVEKLVPVPVDLRKLSDGRKIAVAEKMCIMLRSDIANLATNASLNAKINGGKGKTPSITKLATAAALTAVKNKIPNVSNLVNKLTITQKLVKLKIKRLLVMILINILLLKNLII